MNYPIRLAPHLRLVGFLAALIFFIATLYALAVIGGS